MSRTRWVVTIEDETGGRSVYGAWYDYDKARTVWQTLINASRRYNGEPDAPEWEVDLDELQPWPGMLAILDA